MFSSRKIAGIVVAIVMAGGSMAWAQPKVTAPPSADVEVLIIHARKGEQAAIHGRLAALQRTFERIPSYNVFDLLAQHDTTLPLKQAEIIPIPNGKRLALTYRGVDKTGRFVKLRLEVSDMHMNIRVTSGGLFFHSAFDYKDGRMLLAIRPTLTIAP